MNIQLFISGQRLEAEYPLLYSGSIGVLQVLLPTSGIDTSLISQLRFKTADSDWYTAEITDGAARVPHEVIVQGGFDIALAGYEYTDTGEIEKFLPTNSVHISIGENGYGDIDSPISSETEPESYLAKVENLLSGYEADTSAATEAAEKALAAVSDKASASEVYTKAETDEKLATKADAADVEEKISSVETVSWDALNTASSAKETANNAMITAETAQTIAKGRATGYVFDTYEDMQAALAEKEFVDGLNMGDNLYIRDTGVPDYWWDSTSKQAYPLETQKVDLSEYVKTDDVYDKATTDEKLEAKADKTELDEKADKTDVEEIHNKLSSVYRVCGSIAPIDLPGGNEVGDVYNMSSDGEAASGSFFLEVPVEYGWDSMNQTYYVQVKDVTTDDAVKFLEMVSEKCALDINSDNDFISSGISDMWGGNIFILSNNSGLEDWEPSDTSEDEVSALNVKITGITLPVITVSEGDNIVWTNQGWDKLSASVNLSEYAKSADLADYVKRTDYATTSKAGIGKTSYYYGVGISSNGTFTIGGATNAEINSHTNAYRPITPSNLVYAVTSCTDTEIKSGGTLPVSGAAVYAALDNRDTKTFTKLFDTVTLTEEAAAIIVGDDTSTALDDITKYTEVKIDLYIPKNTSATANAISAISLLTADGKIGKILAPTSANYAAWNYQYNTWYTYVLHPNGKEAWATMQTAQTHTGNTAMPLYSYATPLPTLDKTLAYKKLTIQLSASTISAGTYTAFPVGTSVTVYAR